MGLTHHNRPDEDREQIHPSPMARSAEIRRSLEILREKEWPEPVIADSGNGFHLLYPIDLPNDAESRELVNGVLVALASRFDNDQVKIDTGVHNAARIVRLYGTTNRKGNSTKERPHRRSEIIKTPGKKVRDKESKPLIAISTYKD